MKNINVIFEDLEYMKLVEQKGNKSWREFLLYMLNEVKKK